MFRSASQLSNFLDRNRSSECKRRLVKATTAAVSERRHVPQLPGALQIADASKETR